MNKGKIYCLTDPFTLEVKYIGFTRCTLSTRFSQHKHEALKKSTLSHCYNWFRKCVDKGKLPVISLLEDNIPLEKWAEREQYWINQYDALTNQRKGGNGVHLNTDTEGRIRSVDAKKLPVVQLNLEGEYVNTWSSIIDAEKALIGKYTGNIYRAVRSSSTALNSLWVLESEYDDSKSYTYKGKHWTKIYLFCAYTLELLKVYKKASELTIDISIRPSSITQALNTNGIIGGCYFIRRSNDPSNPPKPKTVYTYNGNYYISLNELYKMEKLPYSIGYHKKRKDNYRVVNITEDIVRTLRETLR